MGDSGVNPNSLPREIMPGVLVCADPAEVARTAARRFVDWAWQAIAQEGSFYVALSGGSTPRELYKLLASSEYRARWIGRACICTGEMSARCLPMIPRAITAWRAAN